MADMTQVLKIITDKHMMQPHLLLTTLVTQLANR